MRLNVVAGTTAYRGIAILFAGDDLEAFVGTENTFPNGDRDITSPGFTPDIVVMHSPKGYEDSSSTAGVEFSVGVGTRDGDQCCWSLGEASNNASGGNPKVNVSTDRIARIITTAGAIGANVSVGSFDSDGFTMTGSVSSTNDLGWLALKFGGNDFAVVPFDTPTSTGVDAAVSGLGFTPAFAFGALTSRESTDESSTITPSSQDSNVSMFAFNAAQAAALCIRSDITDPTDTGSFATQAAVALGANNSVTDIDADLDAFVSGGVSLNYTDVAAAPKFGWMLLVGA